MITIRPERPGDEDAIRDLTAAAFRDMAFSDQSEPAVIDGLRDAGALDVSLLATDAAGAIVGHIAFSKVAVGAQAEGWYGLGPVSVAPGHQRQGIGTRLVEDGVARLSARDAEGVVLIGDPAYYSRFGFSADTALTYGDVPAAYVQYLSLKGARPQGAIAFHPAFDAT